MPLKLKHDALEIFKKAWSVRFMVLAFIFIVLETAMPFLQGVLPVSAPVFGVLSGLMVAASFVARFIAQENLQG